MIIGSNPFCIGSFFKTKDGLPDALRSDLVYKFECSCNATYIGSTSRQFKVRFYEHLGISYRTKIPLNKPTNSAIRDHINKFDHNCSFENFKPLCASSDLSDLRILESLYILKMKPSLNDNKTACVLNIV